VHHILVVDDDPSIRDMLAHALRLLGTVEQAVNGADALRRLGSRKYAVVLLDLHMPLIDGFMVLQTLAIKPGPNGDTPVYVITADTSDHARIRALQRQAIYFLNKPVPIATLISLVRATLQGPAAAPPASAIAAAPDPMNPKQGKR
jgi:CheY-like chemotaxis protein